MHDIQHVVVLVNAVVSTEWKPGESAFYCFFIFCWPCII